MKLLFFFFCIILLKIIINAYNLMMIKILMSRYLESIEGKTNFARYKNQTKLLFKEAGIRDAAFPVQVEIGYGRIASGMDSAMEQMDFHCEYMISVMTNWFAQAKGIFKSRIFESINPIYWVKIFLKLPENLLSYLGLKPEHFLCKFANFIWWIFLSLFAILKFIISEGIIEIPLF